MAYVMTGGIPRKVKISPQRNILTISFLDDGAPVVITSGIIAYLDSTCKMIIGKYPDYKTVYRNDEETAKYNGYQLSNDGSVYIAPAPYIPKVTFAAAAGGTLEGETSQTASDYADLIIPEPIPAEKYEFAGWQPEIPADGEIEKDQRFTAIFVYVPTLEEVQEAKVTEMNAAQQSVIQKGVDVTLTDGTTEHFTLTDHDQTSLMGLQTQVAAGAENIPWHTSDQTEHCKYYSNADMALITTAALACVTWHVTYFRDLRIYIRSLQTKEEVAAVTYGITIPEEFWSEPLKDMIAAQST